jgi:predicted GH43/DUF377 family glycosyl hydrolase
MRRFKGNPILEPMVQNEWESRLVFNAAAIHLKNRIHLLYRAMGNDGISRIGYANTSDGYRIDYRSSTPIFEPAERAEHSGCEDPRVTPLGDTVLMAYTALSEVDHGQLYQISLTSIGVEDFLKQKWKWNERRLPFRGIRNKDGVVFPRKIGGTYVMLHRFDPDICVAYSGDLGIWCSLSSILAPRMKSWDSWKVGAAGTPIELNEGWLVIYHGASMERVYSLGVVLLEKENPENVIYRSEAPILVPSENYERFGKVPNVVFSCGNVLLDNEVLVYYGGADSVLCVATYDLSELLPKK